MKNKALFTLANIIAIPMLGYLFTVFGPDLICTGGECGTSLLYIFTPLGLGMVIFTSIVILSDIALLTRRFMPASVAQNPQLAKFKGKQVPGWLPVAVIIAMFVALGWILAVNLA